jgi:hypothetical protein
MRDTSSLLDDARMALRFVAGLKGFLQFPLEREECLQQFQRQFNNRNACFLQLLEKGVFGNPKSPYRALMNRAGIKLGDVVAQVRQGGVEHALEALFDAGVYVTLDEFKGRKPITRPGFIHQALPRDFDNPFLNHHYEGTTGGTRGVGTRLTIDLGLVAYEAAHSFFSLEALGSLEQPAAVWRPVPPGTTGMKVFLHRAKLGLLPEIWFSQNAPTIAGPELRSVILTRCALFASRLWGKPLPRSEYVPLPEASKVARWLANKKKAQNPGLLDTNVASAIRVCHAAEENGLDISGSVFRTGGEPLTPGRAEIFASKGCRVYCNYGISETGRLGMACGDPAEVDDVHILSDKVALLQRLKSVGANGREVGALYVTTLHRSAPKIMLNVEIGDYAVRFKRSCRCPFGKLGLTEHLHTIRSYEKLTSEGMHFLGSELIDLLERHLPAQFGGGPTDYQLVEEEADGLSRVSLVVSPRVGEVDEVALVDSALNALRNTRDGHVMMTELWRDGSVLQIVRREPYASPAAKIQPLHVEA